MTLGIEKALADLALELAEHKPERVATALKWAHEEWRERAAIREHLGRLTRSSAEVAAAYDTEAMLRPLIGLYFPDCLA